MISPFIIHLFKITFWQKGCLRQLKILKIYYQWSQVQLGLITFGPFFISSKLTSAIKIYGFRWIRSKMPNIQPAHSLDISPTNRLLFFRHIPLSATLYKILVMDFHTWWRYHYFCFTGTAQQSTLSTYFVFGELSDDC